MTYVYAYISKEEAAKPLRFGAPLLDVIDLGPLPFDKEQAFKRIQIEADKLGRVALWAKRGSRTTM